MYFAWGMDAVFHAKNGEVDAWKDEEIMFDERDLHLYKEQMKRYGDVVNHHAFGR